MYTQHGELNGVKWLSEYKGGRSFLLHVGHLEQEYECSYEPIFGVDGADYATMNEIMDEMQQIVLSGEKTSNYNIEQKIKQIEDKKEESRKNAQSKIEQDKIKNQLEKENYYTNKTEEDDIPSLMYQFSAGYIDYKDMVDGITDHVSGKSKLKANFPSDYDFNNPYK